MKRHQWSGSWPTTEYPPKGTRIRYERPRHSSELQRLGEYREGVILFVWCGVEPMFQMDNGDNVAPSLDRFEVVLGS